MEEFKKSIKAVLEHTDLAAYVDIKTNGRGLVIFIPHDNHKAPELEHIYMHLEEDIQDVIDKAFELIKDSGEYMTITVWKNEHSTLITIDPENQNI